MQRPWVQILWVAPGSSQSFHPLVEVNQSTRFSWGLSGKKVTHVDHYGHPMKKIFLK